LDVTVFYNETISQGKDVPKWMDAIGTAFTSMMTNGAMKMISGKPLNDLWKAA
jgi:hypothetical protein